MPAGQGSRSDGQLMACSRQERHDTVQGVVRLRLAGPSLEQVVDVLAKSVVQVGKVDRIFTVGDAPTDEGDAGRSVPTSGVLRQRSRQKEAALVAADFALRDAFTDHGSLHLRD